MKWEVFGTEIKQQSDTGFLDANALVYAGNKWRIWIHDFTPPSWDLFYMVAVASPNPCDPGARSDYTSTLSSIVTNSAFELGKIKGSLNHKMKLIVF